MFVDIFAIVILTSILLDVIPDSSFIFFDILELFCDFGHVALGKIMHL